MLLASVAGVALLLLPLAALLLLPLVEGGLEEAATALGRESGGPVRNSLVFAFGSASLAGLVGSVAAGLVAWTDMPGRRIVTALAILPLFFPGLIYAFGWVLLASPNAGMINQIAIAPSLDVFSLGGMIWVEGHHAVPLVFLLSLGVFRAVPEDAVHMARLAGAKGTAVFRRIVLPLVMPALAAAFALVFVRTLGSFEVPAILGTPAGITLISTYIYFTLQRGLDDLTAIAGFAASVMLFSIVLLWLARRFGSSVEGWRRENARRPALFRLGRHRIGVAVAAIVWLGIASVAPLYALAMRSLTRTLEAQTFWRPWEGAAQWSATNYTEVLGDPAIWSASLHAVLWAAMAAMILMSLAVTLVWASRRRTSPLARQVIAVSHVVFSLPGVIIGLAILVSYGTVTRNGGVLIAIAYCLRGLPYALVYADRAVGMVADRLWSAARMTGAARAVTLWRVLLPLAGPLVLAGMAYVFAISIREVSASVLLYRPGQEVVSVYLWQFWQDGELGRFAALSTCLAIATTALLLPAHRMLSHRVSG